MMSAKEIINEIAMRLCLDKKELAKEIKVSVPTAYSYANGYRKPKIKTIKELLRLAKKAKVKAKVEDFLD